MTLIPNSAVRISNLFVVAGEASGDKHAALVVRELRGLEPALRVRGIGGVHLRREGVELLFDSSRWGAMGFAQVLPKIPGLLRAAKKTREAIAADPPEVLLLVDFGAFNVRLARWAKTQGIPVMYYCPPRSWRRSSAQMGGLVSATDCIATPFPWSAELLSAAGGNAHFVGHPVLESMRASASREELRAEFGVERDEQLVVILPGSRPFEVKALLSRLLRAAAILRRGRNVRFALSLAPNLPPQLLEKRQSWLDTLDVRVVRGGTSDLLCACDFAWVASGTATLEAACFGAPMVIVYDAMYLSRVEVVVRRQRIDHVGMPNLIAGRRIVPELLATELTAPSLVAATTKIMDDPKACAQMREDLRAVRAELGTEGASARTAELVVTLSQKHTPQRACVQNHDQSLQTAHA